MGQPLVVLDPDQVVLALVLGVPVLDLVVLDLDPVVSEPDQVLPVLDPVVLGLQQEVLDQVAMGQGGLGLDPGLEVMDLDPLDKVDTGRGVPGLDPKVLQQAVLALAEQVQDQAATALVVSAGGLEATLSVVKDMENGSHSNQVSLRFDDNTCLFVILYTSKVCTCPHMILSRPDDLPFSASAHRAS